MRATSLIFLASALLAGGCASAPREQSVASPAFESPPRPTAALAFTPAIAKDLPELYLDRDGRGPMAAGGYEAVVVSETWTQQDDRQRWGRWGDQSRFERRSVSTTVTIRR